MVGHLSRTLPIKEEAPFVVQSFGFLPQTLTVANESYISLYIYM